MTKASREAGHTLVGLLQTLAVAALLFTLGAVHLAPTAGGRVAEAGARALAARFAALSVRAATGGRATGLAFPPTGDEPLCEVDDGNGNGVRRADIGSGADVASAPFTVASLVEGARVGRPPWDILSDVPPGGGVIRRADPAVRFGRTRIATFDPEGHATAGTVFVTDGVGGLCAVVVNGVTARVTTWCYERRADAWHRR